MYYICSVISKWYTNTHCHLKCNYINAKRKSARRERITLRQSSLGQSRLNAEQHNPDINIIDKQKNAAYIHTVHKINMP